MKRMGLAGIVLVVAFLTMVGSTAAKTFSQTFIYADAEQTFTVPRGVFVLHVVAVGAKGGHPYGGAAGYGAQVSGDLSVHPGETLYVEVGGEGEGPATEPFNGGGPSTGPGCCGTYSGGGASDVRTAPMSAGLSTDDRLIVAGGGGGAGDSERFPIPAGRGGSAGEAGANGVEYGYERCLEEREEAERRGEEWKLEEHEAACRIEVINEGGGPGTAVRGGTGGGFTGDPAGEGNVGGEGSVGVGGFGPGTLANCCSGFDGGGGGGGGGYYGGGGGAGSRVEVSFSSEGLVWTGGGGGGGGGSSLAPPGGTVEPAREDSQSVRISWSRGRHHRR